MRLLVICFVTWLALASCVDPADPIEPQVTSGVLRKEIPMVVHRQLDLLFVIDSSPAMAPHRERLLASYRDMISALRTLPGGLPDLHLAVVTADLGTHSLMSAIPGCTFRGDDAAFRGFLRDEWHESGVRVRNYEGDLEDAFVRIADVGSSGCAITQPLEAARRALVAQPANAGFLRPHAYLGIVVLAANDDCSYPHASFLDGATDATRCAERADALTPVAHFERVLKSLKPDPSKVVIAAALGDSRPFVTGSEPLRARLPASCPSDARTTRPTVRLAELLTRFPNRSTTASLCDRDLSPLLSVFAQLHKYSLGAPCFDAPLLDVDPVTAGTQPDCAVWTEIAIAGRIEGHVLRACGTTTTGACWKIERDLQTCPDSGELLRFERALFEYPQGVTVVAECAIR